MKVCGGGVVTTARARPSWVDGAADLDSPCSERSMAGRPDVGGIKNAASRGCVLEKMSCCAAAGAAGPQ